MLFADLELFWKSPNVFDVLSLIGLLVGFLSIWLAVRYATRDLTARIAEAEVRASGTAKAEVRRVAQALLQLGLSATIRSLELAREACQGSRWGRAVDLCVLAQEQLAKVLVHSLASEADRAELREVSAILSDCLSVLRRKKSESQSVPVMNGLDRSILTLHTVEARMSQVKLEGDYGS